MRPLQATLAAVLLLAFCAGFNAESIIGTVQVMYSGYKFNGLKVNASGVNESKEIHRFLSIPYAQPPTGNRRFAKPEALDFSRDVEIDASEQPPLCPQDNSTKSLPYSEDCLYMNIWSPDTTSGTKYPVLVYIHGGRFETGGIAEPEYQGETLVRNQNIVFVTINYRLGATGFLYLDSTLMPGNFGLLDQRLALKTITDMISAFGGDPNRITLAGHGTGSASVGFHIATQDVPVTRAVMMGGSHLMPLVWSNDIDAVRGVSERFANIQLNCARGEGKLQEVIECLRNDISIERLIEEQKNYEKLYISLEFMPVLDKEFFNFMDPLITWGERRKNVTLLMGVTADSGIEFALNSLRTRNLTTDILNRDVYYEILRQQFVHYPRFPTELDDTGLKFLQLSHTEWNDAQNKELLLKKWSEALGDFSFLCPTLYALFDDDRPQPGEDMNAYLYYFGAPDPFRDNEAPGHVNDVRYFLGVPDGPGLPYPSEHNELAKRMMEDLANFVTTGRPNNNWRSVIAGDWNYNSYLPVQDPGLYDLTGGFAIRRCRWWYDTLSFVNRLVPGDSAKPMSPLRQDPFLLDGSTIGAAPARSKPQQEAAANNFQPTSAQIIDNATVELTEVGATVRGHRLSANANGKEIERFLGIPYAQPPTGDLRFAKPALKDIANATIDAQTMPKACPQAWNTTLEEDEDCLYLNIWTPRPSLTANESQQVPVLVYFHGGFFEVGGINDPYRSGEKIVELQDVVVVTIGYRLGVLGFLPFSAEGSRGNFGLFDQEMALKWVEANIHHFGGNASLITAVGDDAGAVSIGYHLIRNETRISRVILQTGSPSMAYPLNNDTDGTRMRIEQYLQLMGCNNSTTDAQLACMRAKSVSDINSVYTNEFANKFGPEALVTVDGDFLKEDPWHSVQQGDMSQVPMIVGFVDRPGNEIINRRIRFGELDLANISYDEVLQNIVNASYYNPRLPKELKQPGATLIGMQYRPPLLHRQVLIDSLSEAYSDRFYTCGNNEYLQQVISKRHPLDAFLYHYVFSEKSNVENITSDGASLSEDTFYLFGNPLQGPEWNDEQKSLSEKMIELFTHFAETGNPNPENSLDLWWEYTANLKPYLVLDAQVHNVSVNWGFRINDCGFWQEVLPYVNELKEPPEPTRPPIGPEGEIIDEIIIEIDLGRTQNRISIAGDLVRLPNGKIIKRFLGLPYAEMPLTRWSQASFPKGGNYTAKSMPPACPQTINPVPGGSMSEDCLYINVFFPNDTSNTYPTVVFLHGGNYTSGANSLPEYRGEQLLENEDVILITVNYRLGALGFLFLDDEKLPGNFGLMDQRLALDFIQRAIPFFGGSRTQITLMGHGTDAASAGFHAVTDSKDFFDRMILMGGSPSMPLAWSSSTQNVLEDSEHFVNVQLECARGPLDSVLECLRNLTLDKIMTEQLNMQHSRDHLVFLPVFNQSFFNYTHPYDAEMDKPYMTGVGSDSGRYYIEQSLARRNISWESLNRTIFERIVELQFNYFPRFPERNTATGIQFLKLALTEWNYYDYNKRIKAIWSRAMGDFNFLCPIWEATSDLLRAKQHDIHMYYIDVEDPLRVQEDLIGADHWGDIRYLFGEPLRKDLYPEVHKNLSRLMMHDFVQYIGGSAPSHWNATSQETSDFLLYDILQTDSGGPGNLVSVMVPDGFGLNTGRCPLWKNELPYVKSFVSAPFQEEETSKIIASASRKRPAIGKTSSVKDESEFNLYEVVSNYTVDVPGFGKVTGQTIMTLSNNITMSQFLGVRYAQPPVGNRRLAKPVKPHTTSDSKHLALTMPPMCIQREHHNRNMSEDCLYLNIWTPRRAGRNVNDIPVLVFIHGGFFEVGGISEDRWQGSMILDHYDAVVVTMNYRLGAFGFLSLDNKEVIGNYGLWDQEMALQWVADNIESFGGNKNRITLMGVEAGAVSIGYHMARPGQNRFHQVVLMTGSPYMSYPLTNDTEEARELQVTFVRTRLRCQGAELLSCIRGLSANEINEQQGVFQQLFQRIEFPPVVDGDFITSDPWTVNPSSLMQVPMIFGGVDRPGNFLLERATDGLLLTPRNFTHNVYLQTLQRMTEYFPRFPKSMTTAGRNGLRNHFRQYNGQDNFERDIRDLGLAISDRYYTCANNKFLDAYSKASSQPVYNYLFTEGKEYEESELPLLHASLFEDAFYVFGNPSSPGPARPDEQRELSDEIMRSIVNFARNGEPGGGIPWERYDASNKSHLLLDADNLPPRMYKDGYRRQQCGFWDEILPYVNSLNDTGTTPPPTAPPTRPPIGPDGTVVGNATASITPDLSIVGHRVLTPNGMKNISRFLGVPYAEPPVGDLRFAPPRAIPNSPGKFIAQTLPHACPQDNRTLGVAYSEDCLYLNIWTPDAVQGRNYPVIVYLHGGNFESGSISQRELFGENLLSYEDVVLVTVAYRLGAFGFLYLSDSELPGNMGLLDQRLALNEVKRYISMFGGDPENIALAGHGIGAAAVGFHSITASKQNFKRAIMMGGSPTIPMAWYDSNGGKENTRELNLAFVSLALGCPSTTISEAITCLKTLDTKNIVDAQTPFLQLLLTLEFRPVLDSAFFNNRDPLEAWRHQEQGSSNTEMLMGFTTDTGGSYVEQALVNQNLTLADIDTETYKELLNRTFPYHPRFPRKLSETGTDFINLYFDDYIGSPDKQTLLNTWGQAVGDRYFLCPVWETIVQKGRNQTSTETYLYVFTARDPWDTDRMQLGSDHQADLRYFFGIPAGTGIAYPESHRNLSVRMMRDIVKFVKDGKPNPSWQTTKLGVWDYADYNNLYSDRYNATEGASTIQRCGVWYYDLPYVDGLVKSAKKSPEPLRRKSALSLPDVTTNEAPKSDSIIPRRTRTAIRNYNVSVSGYGTVVGSTVLTTDNNTISEFLGVRYAQPPLGDLRFKKPEPLRDAGDGVTHLALEMGLPCYQRNYYNFANMSEDCLTLNIWTPRTESNPSGTYPVIVFIHGGFFEVGSSAESRWNGENILDHEQAVIVTINYRLGAFGFLALNSSMASGITGNMGLFDQEAAISWVAKNIEAFGGDKNAITLAGAEAGSISVGYHLLREPTANKPFHRVIMMTGSPIQSYPLSDKPDFVKQYHAEFVRTLNCSSDVVNCLQSLSADVINEKQEDFNQIFTGIEFQPIIDNDFFTADPWVLVRDGKFAKMPMIIGQTSSPGNFLLERIVGNIILNKENFTLETYRQALVESNTFFPRFPTQMTTSGQEALKLFKSPWANLESFELKIREWAEALSDRYFTCDITEFTEKFVEKNPTNSTYYYLFDEKALFQGESLPLLGATLFEDAFFFFGNPTSPGPAETVERANLSESIMRRFVKFARDGNPNANPSSPTWRPYELGFKKTKYFRALGIDRFPELNFGFRRQDCGWWEKVLPYVDDLVYPATTTATSPTATPTTTSTTAPPTTTISATSPTTITSTSTSATTTTMTPEPTTMTTQAPSSSTRPPIGPQDSPDSGFYALVTVIPILGVALIGLAIFVVVKVVMGASSVVAPTAAAAGGGAAAFGAAEAGTAAAPASAAPASAENPTSAEVVNEAYEADGADGEEGSTDL
ncbi:hypothetical protein BOX15_Mlig018316g1 [Macrostomum lignano]|uniref:Carboxylesterase type B domain-containing protein n=1 Tax=Macrostomum lignano TaxID=282301 RepID=A0A267FF20_9PLAT|nr:hypothetical protein BOX15_Mlig018316g1 [Macrostomum lignano]